MKLGQKLGQALQILGQDSKNLGQTVDWTVLAGVQGKKKIVRKERKNCVIVEMQLLVK